jgi:hypothetical protein
MLEAAESLALEQALYADRGAPEIKPATVVRRLVESANPSRTDPKTAVFQVRDENGTLIASGERERGGALTVRIPARKGRSRAAILAAVERLMDHFVGSATEARTDAEGTP